jgi:hypothetical protein
MQIDAAAESYCLENKLPFDTKIEPERFAQYLLHGKVPLCPLGAKPYAPFTAQQGPRCPNSAQHNQTFIAATCRGEMSKLWEAAICCAAVARLSWNSTIDPTAGDVLQYAGKGFPVCRLGTKPYAPFTLARGPVCPNSPAHNTPRYPPWGPNRHMFNPDGRANTNLPLSRANTNLF